MTVLLGMLLAPLVTAALGAVEAPRAVKEGIAIGGLAVTWLLCLATASQFLDGAIPTAFDEALRVDGLSALVLVLCGFVGLLSAAYGVGYLRRNELRGLVTPRMRLEFAVLTPVYVFAMLLVVVSNNLGILWIAVELTTLTSVFLVAFHDHDTSLEAAWKFLMLGSLGLGFALLGTVLAVRVGARTLRRRALGAELDAIHGDRPNPASVHAAAWRRLCVDWIRHQGGSGPDAYLEAGCLSRGPVSGWSPDGGRHVERRVLLPAAQCT